MTSEMWSRVEGPFVEAANLGVAERTERLDEILTKDPELWAEVKSLLDAHDEVDALLGGIDKLVTEPDFEPLPDPLPRLNVALEGRYVLLYELGQGGMSTVYLADDVKHGRKVALKVLRPGLAAVIGAERFLAEIKTTASLQHPNILPLHDSGEADGFLFYVMPYVEGDTLKDRLDREGQLPLREALAITRDMAEAIGAAHEQGVVHRDIKPANILLSRGRPMIADFGIALALTSTTAEEHLAESGLSLGTPAYMSPEQATGEYAVGPAADTWALGCVLYEMLVGAPPFAGDTARAVLSKVVADEPTPAVEKRPSVPAHVDAAIRKALEKRPADRFGSVEDFGRAVGDERSPLGEVAAVGSWAAKSPWKRLGVGVVTLVTVTLAALASGLFDRAASVVADAVPIGSIAVLPFENLSSDSEQDYFSDGLAEGVLNALAQVEGFHVIARSSAFSFKGQDIEIQEIATRLGVAHVLEGSVERVGGRVHITAQLIETSTNRQLWSEQFDRDLELSEVFAVQDDISRRIAEALMSTMGLGTAPTVRTSQVVSAEGYDLYLRGLHELGPGTIASYNSARPYFERAIVLEPTYAVAYSGLARALLELGRREVPDDVVREAANEAIRLDPTLGLPYSILSLLEERPGGQPLSERTLELRAKGYELAPNDPWVTMQYGRAFEARGRMAESLPLMRKAIALGPLDPVQRSHFGWYLTQRGRPTEGLQQIEAAMEIAPNSPVPWRYKGDAAPHVGDFVSAIEAYRVSSALDPVWVPNAGRIARNYLDLGDLEAARAWMDNSIGLGNSPLPTLEAEYLLMTGQEEEALELALQEFKTQAARIPHATLMQVVVADMLGRGELEEAERFLLRYEPRLVDFMAEPVQHFVGDPALAPVNLEYAIALQDVYRRAGRTSDADALAERLEFESMQGRLSHMQLDWTGYDYRTEALWHMRHGRHSEALSALEQAVELGFRGDYWLGQGWRLSIRDNFVFEDLWETPRFKALIETIEADMATQREILADRTAAWIEELGTGRDRPGG